MTDKKARQILFNTYWSAAGWKKDYTVAPEDFRYAKNAGVMFEPVRLSHDEVVRWLQASLLAVNREDVSKAFLASLSTRRLEYRSALGSFAIARNFPVHAYLGKGYGCSICGDFEKPSLPRDLSVMNFERIKWGGVRHERPDYIAFDLEQFAKLDRVEPTGQDLEIMRQIIDAVNQCLPGDRPRDLERRLAAVIQSNKAERENLIQILAYCGILQPGNRSGYFQAFTPDTQRELPPVSKIDWTYPVCWWRGADGIQQDALRFYFPDWQLAADV